MAKAFIHDDFLLQNKFAQELYHEYAKELPIIDYHCHLSPKDIADDRIFENITQAWIYGDHYKWRAMRTSGINEDYVTGTSSDLDKFKAWAKTVPQTLRNPLYHWTHLELARYFGFFDLLNETNAEAVYNLTSEQLRSNDFSCRSLLSKMKVEVVCTTDDPIDSLEYHRKIAPEDTPIIMGSSFRPDKALSIDSGNYNAYIDLLAEATEMEITSYDHLCNALVKRMAYFAAYGCTLSDHGLESVPFEPASSAKVSQIFAKKRDGKQLDSKEIEQFKTALLLFLSERYNDHGWVQQFHLGPLRNNNSRMLKTLGPDTGWDSIGDFSQASNLSRFLNTLDANNKLAKTILYNSNPADNEVFAAMCGNFNDGSVKGKVQYGSGWWFLDQKDGIIKQLNALSNIGLISCFVGMLTDSRSFLSFPRHEYFRRVLCNLFGEEMQKGELPGDVALIGQTISNICYHNAKAYFEFN